MKSILTSLFITLISTQLAFSQSISPYYDLGSSSGNIEAVSQEIQEKTVTQGYDLLGIYSPGNQSDLVVIVFTNAATKTMFNAIGREALIAANYRIGLEKTPEGVRVSTVNPVYQWNAYLTDSFEKYQTQLEKLNVDYLSFCESIATASLSPFGGELSSDDLSDYHYMIGMPYFDDQVEIGSFGSYEEALRQIEASLNSTNGIKHVYTQKNEAQQFAVFGIGLTDPEIGESHFLSIIGQSHVAAMPYELIVDGNEVFMLHGRFRFALYWPELTMGTFTKIMSTPGDVEELMKRLMD